MNPLRTGAKNGQTEIRGLGGRDVSSRAERRRDGRIAAGGRGAFRVGQPFGPPRQ
jgi:hypothetical protein